MDKLYVAHEATTHTISVTKFNPAARTQNQPIVYGGCDMYEAKYDKLYEPGRGSYVGYGFDAYEALQSLFQTLRSNGVEIK